MTDLFTDKQMFCIIYYYYHLQINMIHHEQFQRRWNKVFINIFLMNHIKVFSFIRTLKCTKNLSARKSAVRKWNFTYIRGKKPIPSLLKIRTWIKQIIFTHEESCPNIYFLRSRNLLTIVKWIHLNFLNAPRNDSRLVKKTWLYKLESELLLYDSSDFLCFLFSRVSRGVKKTIITLSLKSASLNYFSLRMGQCKMFNQVNLLG